MSATRDLIAAALTLADIDEQVAEMPTEAATDVREMCARAMVEVERLVREYGNACRSDAVDVIATGDDPESCGAAHAALLDYVRGHFVCPNKMVVAKCDGNHGGPRCADPECWNDEATATQQPVSAEEVPMPEPNYDGYDEIDRFLRNNLDDDDYDEYMSGLHQYGDAREAAGYARGLAENAKDAERYRWLRDGTNWPAAFARHDAPEPLIGVDLDAAIDAALRGEGIKGD